MALRSKIDNRIEVRAGVSGTFETPGALERSPGDAEAKEMIREFRRRAQRASEGLCDVGEKNYINLIDAALTAGQVHVEEVGDQLAWKSGPKPKMTENHKKLSLWLARILCFQKK